MTKKKVTLEGQNIGKVMGFLNNAYEDYISARILLLNGKILIGSQLANTCIEKYFKAMKAMHGESIPRHHDISAKKIIKGIKNKFKSIYTQLNLEFISLLSQSYKLRYLDDLNIGFNITLSQNKILAELDYTVSILNSFYITKDGDVSLKRFDVDIESNNPVLFTNNYILEKKDKSTFLKQQHKIEQHLIDESGQLLSIEYISGNLIDDGVFIYDCSQKDNKIPLIYSKTKSGNS